MINIRKNMKGFTLIELVIVMVILGILAVVAVPQFVDLGTQAETAATQAAVGAIRSALAVAYASRAATGDTSYPTSLTAADFANNQLPTNRVNTRTGIGTVFTAPGGTATHATDGFWYIPTTGQAGAYSDSTVNTVNF